MGASPVVPDDITAAATEANRVALVAAQSLPKFRSVAERDAYEEARALRAAIEGGLEVSILPPSVLFRC